MNIIIFAGTTEGKMLSNLLIENKIFHTISVATQYGEEVLRKSPYVRICTGRKDRSMLVSWFQEEGFDCVIDATHPYAKVISENLRAVATQRDITYLRLKRDLRLEEKETGCTFFADSQECAKALVATKGNILLTTGSKELKQFAIPEILGRVYARVLPGRESLTLCEEAGIPAQQMIAMQGPFSMELNLALMKQYNIKTLVTKNSGSLGGYDEKIAAARNAGAQVFVLGAPKEEGYSFAEVCEKLGVTNEVGSRKAPYFDIHILGAGMGRGCLTEEASALAASADIILGAERLIEAFEPRLEKKPYYMPAKILSYLEKELPASEHAILAANENKLKVVILMSGDTGFYSGATKVYQQLRQAVEEGRLQGEVALLPGISSMSYLAAKAGISYEAAKILSLHGRRIKNLKHILSRSEKVFLLLEGLAQVQALATYLQKVGLEESELILGYQLSYEDEMVIRRTPAQCLELDKEGLYACFLLPKRVERPLLTYGLSDQAFLRGQVPMTKEEVRQISISKLRLTEGAICYDIGCGTGSVSIEIARLSEQIEVYAVEKNAAACELIRRNMEAFAHENIELVQAEAPLGMEAWPAPTHAFIGGSSGNMREILDLIYQKNPRARVVINAVTLETIACLQGLLSEQRVKNLEITQVQISKAHELGRYHMLQSENPVWIYAFDFLPEED